MGPPPEVYRIIVVGMNRPRLTKILSLLDEARRQQQTTSETTIVEGEPSLPAASFSIDVIPCLAHMDSYEDADGKQIRYLANFVHLDGSAMVDVFDDEEMLVQQPLSGVAMVGYEWAENDNTHIENYFKTNNLPLEVECVRPEAAYESLHEEMDALKSLSSEERDKCIENGTMGPGKMVRYILDFIDHIQEDIISRLKPEPDEVDEEGDAEQSEEPLVTERLPPNPDLPRFACRICRTVLFGEDDLATNHVQNLHNFKRGNFQQNRQTVACQSIFLKDSVLEFLAPQGQDIEGKLACTKCSAKIGHWKWAGAQCSCGTWVTPAIQVPSSKVDILQPQSKVAPIGIVAPSAAAMM